MRELLYRKFATNDQLVYFKESDLRAYLDEIADHNMPVTEIGFTGGEPFMNAKSLTCCACRWNGDFPFWS